MGVASKSAGRFPLKEHGPCSETAMVLGKEGGIRCDFKPYLECRDTDMLMA
ncbi:hypothetical protein VN12_20075 [Pirellula sp. SH-Sr6A]|nr:hypothetical protein VN12_20075 [Pirellula sp. SH-Sr6A]